MPKETAKKGWFTWSRLLWGVMLLCVLTSITILTCDYWVEKRAEGRCYDEIDNMPSNKTGLVFTTSKYGLNGELNEYFTYRVKAAAELLEAGKIEYILISGNDKPAQEIDPSDMQEELVRLGVPAKSIVIDTADVRTFESVVRSNQIFGQESITIISQDFVNKRALYIAQKYGMEAVAFNADSVSGKAAIATNFRELFARVRAVWDINVIFKNPKAKGDHIEIG